ncbi:MAG: glycoside hydrolase family 2 protein [Clostridiales bacterium]|nr:glycoside hydrolase family 2 protein [Clostridiales bacterium]
MKKTIRLNNNWFYNPDYNESMIKNDDVSTFDKVNLPHTNIELPYNYFDEKMFQFVSCYKNFFEVSLSEDEKLCARFEGVMAVADVFINGHFVDQHLGGYTPFEYDLTPYIKNGDNVLTVKVDSRELENIPPFGGQIDYLTYGGIYREVELRIYDQTYIKHVRIETLNNHETNKAVLLHMSAVTDKVDCKATLDVKIKNQLGKQIKSLEVVLNLNKEQESYDIQIDNVQAELWDLESPNLYTIELTLTTENGKDHLKERFGFRTCEFKADGFYLNNRKIQLMGINRHQSYPYVGYAMPKRVQEKDAVILKDELHFNLVRTSHYPQSKHFLNKCDELGILVFEEIPGWQHIGNQTWKDVAIQNVKEMIERDWNHPSIIIWGVRINESQDDHDFYTSTNELARVLDPTRQTGGVRYIDNSEFLEDVYTMNDFVLDGGETALRDQKLVTGLDRNVPYLVTEYNGHMYPTKRFDCEERQMEHVKRHLRVQDAAFRNENISGAIGWCAFDYNTHNDFGAGDRICYHGIMDMFRVNKFAASVYKSQVSPKIDPVLEPVTFWARGERSIGGILPLTVLTNCDYITLSFGELKTFKLFPSEVYDGLPYPPVIVDESIVTVEDLGEWGMKWEDGIIKGFVNDACVISKTLSKNPLPTYLSVKTDDLVLNSNEKDATRTVVSILDQAHNLLPFFDRPVTIDLTGPAKLHGPSVVVPKGGVFGFWIETINKTGIVDLTLACEGLAPVNIQISIV